MLETRVSLRPCKTKLDCFMEYKCRIPICILTRSSLYNWKHLEEIAEDKLPGPQRRSQPIEKETDSYF